MIGEIRRSRQKVRKLAELRQTTSTISCGALDCCELRATREELVLRIHRRAPAYEQENEFA